MKKKNYLTGLILTLFFAAVMMSATKIRSVSQEEGSFPEEINDIIQGKCFGCHNTESRNDKAKEKLLFDKFDSLSVVERIGKFRDIEKELNDNKMPPEQFLNRFPERALTADEKKILLDWAGNERKNVN